MNEPSVLDYLSFDATATGETMIRNNEEQQQQQQQRMQGVLWKRRDLFKNHWRPRWFVLHREQHLLTYYLVANNSQQLLVDNNRNNRSRLSSSSINSASQEEEEEEAAGATEETISSSSIDYDVVPRGTIYLSGSSIESNSILTNPEENLYVLTITDSQEKNRVYLAARSVLERDKWIQQLHQVCHQQSTTSSTSMVPSSSSYPQQDQQQQEEEEQEQTLNNTTAKWTTIPNKNLEEKLPKEMIATMDRLFETYLPYVEQIDHPDLLFKFEKNGIHCSFHKGKNLIRSIRNVEGHSPLDYLQLLWNMERDVELEANVTAQEPLHTYNNNTAVLYKAYQAVWPTGPREFCSTAHWRLLQKDNNKSFAVCLLAFSCPEAESFRPNVADKHVRGRKWKKKPTVLLF